MCAFSTRRRSTTGLRRRIARARSSSSRKLTASRSCGRSAAGIVAGSPSNVSGSRPCSTSRSQRRRLSSTPASESAAEASRSAVGRSGTIRWIGIVPASIAAWMAAPIIPITARRVSGDCGSLKTRLTPWTATPCTPSAAASDLASTTLIAPGRPAGSVRRRRDQTGAPVTVAVICAIVAADARPSAVTPSRRPITAGRVSRSTPISVSNDSGSGAARSSCRQ